MARATIRPAVLLLTAAAGLVGCGQTGPLYLPEAGTVVTRPAPTTPPAPEAPPPAAEPPTPAAPPASPAPPPPGR